MIIILTWQTIPVSASFSTDTTKSIPFVENWESDSTLHLHASCPTGVPGKQGIHVIKIEPNPASDKIDISSDYLISSIGITDLFGREQLNFNNIDNKEIRINLSGLADGIYLLIAQNRSGQAVQKVIVHH